MNILKNSSVHLKNEDYVEKLLANISRDGALELQVVTDFDRTLSVPNVTSFDVLEHNHLVSDENQTEMKRLSDHYHAIEVNPDVCNEEKMPLMVEWYEKIIERLLSSNIYEKNIGEIVGSSRLDLRNSCDTLFHLLYSKSVPVLVFSAGAGDIIKACLEQEGILFPNVTLLSNYLKFNEEGKLSGIKGECMHSLNKTQFSIGNASYFDNLSERQNVIILGDSLSDVQMAEGIRKVKSILKIGILIDKTPENLNLYMDTYDIVIDNDLSSFNMIFELFKVILK